MGCAPVRPGWELRQPVNTAKPMAARIMAVFERTMPVKVTHPKPRAKLAFGGASDK
jgi:hypothetical protein